MTSEGQSLIFQGKQPFFLNKEMANRIRKLFTLNINIYKNIRNTNILGPKKRNLGWNANINLEGKSVNKQLQKQEKITDMEYPYK